MILVDNRAARPRGRGPPIQVAFIGAGFMAQGLANQIAHSVPGMRAPRSTPAGSSRRSGSALRRARRARRGDHQGEVEDAIRAQRIVVTDDAMLLCRAEQIDVLVDLTGSVEFGAHVVARGRSRTASTACS
jgi:predicted homoserine dehydrogenase-like protein